MTSELKPNEIISEFVSGGPENYAYKTFNSITGAERTVCKVIGITLKYNASQLVNFENIKDMILTGIYKETVIVHTEIKIKRKRGKGVMEEKILLVNPKTKQTESYSLNGDV